MVTLISTLLLQPFSAQVMRNEVVEFKPKAEHHFSLEAPQKCGASAPVEAGARKIKCQFLTAGKATATFNVCDDKKTFCKPVTVDLEVSAAASTDPVRLNKNEHLNQDLKKMLIPGFAVGTPDEISRVARAKKQPILLMISTDWCPPCNEAKEYLLNTEAFQKATQDWFKVYVDGDSLAAVEWAKKIPYKYYPSFVALNSDMEEIGRYNAGLRQAAFAEWLRQQASLVEDPITLLQKRVLARKSGAVGQKIKDLFRSVGPAQIQADESRLLDRALDQEDHEVIRQVATPRAAYPELTAKLIKYRLQRLDEEEKPDPKRKLALLRELLQARFTSDFWPETLAELCETDVDECKMQISKIEEREKFMLARPGFTDTERASLLAEENYNLASAFESLKDKAKVKEYAMKCVAFAEALRARSQLKQARGALQTLVPCLEKAERYAEAEKWIRVLAEAYPKEPTFLQKMAALYRKQGKLDQALVWIQKAEQVAYGFNWFIAVRLKSDILIQLKREAEAQKVLQAALDEVQLSEDRDSRYQLVAARLRATQAKIQP